MRERKPDLDQGANRYRAFRGMTMRQLTEQVNLAKSRGEEPVSLVHVANALRGRTRPSPTLRRHLPSVLGISLQACFDADLLGKEHQAKKAQK